LPDVAGTFPEHEVVAAKRLCDLFSFVRSVCFVVKFTDKMFRQCSVNVPATFDPRRTPAFPEFSACWRVGDG
jgi:hypothetical protein